MLYEGGLVPILVSLIYCAIVAVLFGTAVSWGCPPPHPLKAPKVDTDAVGAIGHCVRDRAYGPSVLS